jgi:hypothetical protein
MQKIKKQETIIVATPPAIAPRIIGCRSFALLFDFVEVGSSFCTGESDWLYGSGVDSTVGTVDG